MAVVVDGIFLPSDTFLTECAKTAMRQYEIHPSLSGNRISDLYPGRISNSAMLLYDGVANVAERGTL